MTIFAKKTETSLTIEGMTCSSCAHHVTRALETVPGVVAVDVDVAAGKARVVTKGSPDVTAMTAAVSEAGYGAQAA